MSLLLAVLATPVLFFIPLPGLKSWPFLAASIVLHTGYKLFLVRAYSLGGMSQVYPIARGTAPLIVAIATQLLIGGRKTPATVQAIGFALGTACFIAAYSTIDGIGTRHAGSVNDYPFLPFVLEAIPIGPIAIHRRGLVAVFQPTAG